ncbi:MAG: putative TetR family transcriptional regulator [Acidimicrobiia bacterium]|nr:putative TetR family transcriptional regulator [Acidimicrobiia bacterium]
MLDTAVRVFGDKGYFATSMDDLAAAAEVSRATVYQYFPDKQEIFEDLVVAMGRDLLRMVRRLGPLGPTPEGYRNLQRWVEEFVTLYRRFAPVFIQWSEVMLTSERLRDLGGQWVESYCDRLTQRLEAAGAVLCDATTAMAVLAMTERASYYLATGQTRLDAGSLLEAVTTSIQVTLFPSTDRRLLVPAS